MLVGLENWHAYVMLITTRVRKTAMLISLSLSGSIELYLPRHLHEEASDAVKS